MTKSSSARRRAAARARAEERARRAKRQRQVKWASGIALAVLVLAGLVGWTVRDNGDTVDTASGGTDTSGTDLSQDQAILAFYQCLRDNGLDVDDPDRSGMIALPFDMDDPAVATIVDDCRDQWLDGSGPMTGGEGDLADTAALVEFVSCMQDSGIDMPDPGPDGALALPEDVDPQSAEFQGAIEDCQHLLAGGGVKVTR